MLLPKIGFGTIATFAMGLGLALASASGQAGQIAAAGSSCGCECVAGLPQTLCTSVEAAQKQEWSCPPSYTCPIPSLEGLGYDARLAGVAAKTAQPQAPVLRPPHPQAENCRAVRVWHRQLQAYTSVNICDVQQASP